MVYVVGPNEYKYKNPGTPAFELLFSSTQANRTCSLDRFSIEAFLLNPF
jgi:hypothetical protein